MKIEDIATAVLVPCFNEEKNLQATCDSLGFGPQSDGQLERTWLILVDNGSTDQTLEVAYEVRRRSPEGVVIVGSEPQRGYVPPRDRGVRLAADLAVEHRLTPSQLFLIQADADTLYDAGYIAAMRSAALVQGLGVLIEAVSAWPTQFAREHAHFIEFLDSIDGASNFAAQSDYDVVIDDKASGFWLRDYLTWGGHKREYTSIGDEIHAETTRLFMRAKAQGAQRMCADGAIARHSVRRWFERPLREFASAGFPRERSWQTTWEEREQHASGFPDLSKPFPECWNHALYERRRHLRALFEVLPLHVANAAGQNGARVLVEPDLPLRTKDELIQSPGRLIEDVFAWIS